MPSLVWDVVKNYQHTHRRIPEDQNLNYTTAEA